jgi:NhaP-type Na+/H+ or K+/H+ antiporter
LHEYTTILGIVLVVLGYGFFSKLLSRYNLSGPMIFTTIGIVLSPLVLGSTPVHPNAQAVQIVAEIALVTILFSDAAFINLRHLKSNGEWRIPTRLLFVALPVTIVLSYFVAKIFFPDEDALYLLLLALFLAPTDAALGKAVVSDLRIAEKVRNAINVESGLNDGIVFPVLLTLLVLIGGGAEEARESTGLASYLLKQIGIGALAGGVIGWAGALTSRYSMDREWMEHQYGNLIPIALAIFSYYLAEHFSGNGYIAAFFSGLLFGNTVPSLRVNVEEFAESEGEFLVMISFLVFGLVFVPESLPFWSVESLLYALLSLTLLRMLPVALSLFGFGMDLFTKLFIGWFGPRGIASILYIIVAIHSLGGMKGHEEIFATASLTILLSIFLHGLSAQPLAILYSRRYES